jgi:hypothetical protein
VGGSGCVGVVGVSVGCVYGYAVDGGGRVVEW